MGKILVELTPWLLSDYAEQGLEGMKEGFKVLQKNELPFVSEKQICLKGEWKLCGEQH